MKKNRKEYNQLSNPNCQWYPMFSDDDLREILFILSRINPRHPFLMDEMLIGKN